MGNKVHSICDVGWKCLFIVQLRWSNKSFQNWICNCNYKIAKSVPTYIHTPTNLVHAWYHEVWLHTFTYVKSSWHSPVARSLYICATQCRYINTIGSDLERWSGVSLDVHHDVSRSNNPHDTGIDTQDYGQTHHHKHSINPSCLSKIYFSHLWTLHIHAIHSRKHPFC